MSHRLLAVVFGLGLSFPALFGAEIPRPAPELVIRQVNGKQLLLSQYRGKVVALEFLQTTCPHCQTCSALLNKMYQKYGPQGFQPVGIAFNDMATMLVPDYVKQLDLKFPVGVASRDEVLNFLQHPVVEMMYVPQLLFIDRKGVIRAHYPGESDFFKNEEANMQKEIEGLLKAPASGATTPKGKRTAKPS